MRIDYGDDWAECRAKRLEIDDNECRMCGSKDNLEVHHKIQAYYKNPKGSGYCTIGHNDPNKYLTTLCHKCHKCITSSMRARRYAKRKQIKIPYERQTPGLSKDVGTTREAIEPIVHTREIPLFGGLKI